MNFQYVAYTSDRRIVKGMIDVASELAAEQALIKQGYQPITLKSMTKMPAMEQIFPSLFKVKPKEVIMFSRQLATLLEAGISVVPALQMIQEQTGNRLFRSVILTILSDLRAGSSFSDALSKHTKIFGRVYYRLVAVGEQTGGLEASLKQAAKYIEKEVVAKKKVKRALTYPVIVLVVALIVISVLVVFVLPSMISMFSSLNVKLPWPTRMLIALMGFLTAYKLYLFLGVVALVVGGLIAMRQPKARYKIDGFMLKAPVIGIVNLMNEMARLSQTVAILLHAGLALPDIIEMARETTSNRVLRDALADVRRELVQGEGLSGPMGKKKVFPRLLVQMVMVGEESGNLESTLNIMAEGYEVEADDRLNGLISLIEPAMTIALALAVAFIALSVIMPMYSVLSAFG